MSDEYVWGKNLVGLVIYNDLHLQRSVSRFDVWKQDISKNFPKMCMSYQARQGIGLSIKNNSYTLPKPRYLWDHEIEPHSHHFLQPAKIQLINAFHHPLSLRKWWCFLWCYLCWKPRHQAAKSTVQDLVQLFSLHFVFTWQELQGGFFAKVL